MNFTTSQEITIPEPPLSRLLFANTRFAWVWIFLRLYIAWQWLEAGYAKVNNPAWVGDHAGVALHGFLSGSLRKMSGEHPDVSQWYGSFISGFVLHHTVLFSYLVSYGELMVGIVLVLGLFTGIAAFFGAFMNMNYLFAGTVSINPVMFLIELFLILSWRISGWYGLDRYALPLLGVPWQPGKLFKNHKDGNP